MAGISHHLRVAACALTAFVVVGCTEASPPPPPPVSVTVDGAAHSVDPGTTFGELIQGLDLHAGSGRLLSVTGRVLEPRRDPGRILLNGVEDPRSTALHTGDAVTVVDGTDTTEGTKRTVNELPGLHPAVPQRSLATYPMKEIDVIGRLSGELKSTRFHRTGPGKVPDKVALTFDDGPWPVQTRQVLKVLHRYHAKATFFMIGNLVERYPSIAQEVHKAGMPIGDHSWSHPLDPTFAELPPHRLSTEIMQTADQLRTTTGVEPYLFRPPGGSYDDEVLTEAHNDGMRTVTWSIDPSDYLASKTKKELAAYILHRVRPGSIVLMHDGGGDQHATIAALPLIIKGIRKMGLELTTIPREH
jgi:peptidoglycan/xylan/chitin deacetylase (PgdA/CDA1 family)